MKPIIVHRLSKQSKCTWTNRNHRNRVIDRSSSLKLKPNILNIWISSKEPHQQQGMFIHFDKRGSLAFNQLHGCSVGRSNQDLLTASLSPAAIWRRCTHFLTLCAPAMQQRYELKNERRGGAWERGGEGWGAEERVDEGGKKRQVEIIVKNICSNNDQITATHSLVTGLSHLPHIMES